MEITGVGSGIMLALAAGLWLVYLVPSWLRSREFTATERNAVRLQQTLRILAETAEVPAAIRAETSARGVLEQERLMKLQERQRAAVIKAQETAARPAPSAARRLRRTRAVTSLVLLVAAAVLVVQVPAAFVSGLTGTAFAIVMFAGIALVSAFALLGRLNEIARSRAAVAPVVVAQAPVARRVQTSRPVADAAPAQTTWTPVPLPKPMYLSRQVVMAPVVANDGNLAASIAVELERAAQVSEQALRAAQASPEVTPMRSRPAAEAAPSRFAAMGRLSDADLERTDIDEVLRRRRLAG